jgi:PAS domain S-box-containing protein
MAFTGSPSLNRRDFAKAVLSGAFSFERPLRTASGVKSNAMNLAEFTGSANDMNGAFGATDLFAAIVNSSPDAIISQTLDGRVTSFNPAAASLFGYQPEDMIGKSIRRLIPKERQDEEDSIIAKIKAGVPVESYTTVRLDSEQRAIDVSLTISPIRDQRGKISGASKIYRNIASQKDALEALRWRQFIDQAPVAMLVLDRDMVHLACSRRWVELHGTDAGIGRYHYDLFPQVPEHWREAHRRGLAGETVSADEELFEHPDGGKQWFRWEVRPWLMSDGAVGGITIMTEDVTDKVLAVQALRESEMRMRLAQDAARAGALEWRLADNSLHFSDSMWTLCGVPKPEGWEYSIEGWAEIIHPAERERVIAAVTEAAALGHDYAVPWRLNLPEGEPERWFITRCSPIIGANGTPDQYFGVNFDITEQKLAEDALRASEVRMRLAQEAARAGAWEWRLSDNCIRWSETSWGLCGRVKPENWAPIDDTWKALLHPADYERVASSGLREAELGQDIEIEWRLNLPEGEPERWFMTRGRPIVNANGASERYFGVVIEITEQKRAEKALRESEVRMRLAQEAARAGAWEWRLSDNCIRWFESSWSLHGLVMSDKWAPITETWENLLHPADYDRVASDGLRAAKLGQEINVEWRSKTLESEPERWFLTRGRPIASGSGASDRYFGVVIEITEQKRAEKALRESEMRMRLAHEAAKAGAWEWKLADNSLQISDSLWSLFGKPRPEGGVSSIAAWAGIIHPADRERVVAAITEAAAFGLDYAVPWRLHTPEGEPERWFITRGSPIVDASGRPDRYFGVVIDITEQKLAEDALRESEMRMRLAQEGAKAGAWELRLSDGQLGWTDSLWDMYGIQKPEEWEPTLGAWLSLLHPADQGSVTRSVSEAVAFGREINAQWRLSALEGQSERWFLSRGRPITDQNGAFDRYFGVVIEITEQKLMEQALRESEMRMHLAQEAARSGAWEWDLAESRVQWSESLWNLYGIQKPERWEPTLEAWKSLVHPADRERITMEIAGAITQGRELEVQWRLELPEGEPERWFLSRGRPIVDANGRPGRYFGVIIEISEQKRMEGALRASEERQTFLLALNDAVRTVDDPFETIAIASKMLGQKLDAAQVVYAKAGESGRASITQEWNDGVSSGAFAIEVLDDFAPALIEVLANGRTAIVCDVRLDPSTCAPEALALFERGSIAAFITVPFLKNGRLAGGLGVHKRAPHAWKADEIALAQEVAERTWEAVERARVSQALRESEERLEFALQAGEAAPWELSITTGEFVNSDKAMAFLLPPGTPATLQSVMAHVYPEDQPRLQEGLLRALEGGSHAVEWRKQLPDGSFRWLETRGQRRTVSGKQVVAGLIHDITQKIDQKESAEKAAKAKSEFLSNMSHELRTPMHAILSYSDMGQIVLAESQTEAAKEYLGNIKIAGSRLLGLLNDLLDLAKMQAGKMIFKRADTDFTDVIRHALMEVRPLLAQKCIEVQHDAQPGQTLVHIDKARLIQVLVNLLSNAIKFSGTGKTISIGISYPLADKGAEVMRCRVADEGPGIPEGELQSVFDKFVQSSKTKTGAGGTGLGLAICREIVEAHDGKIWAENIEPQGAAFFFDIPLATVGEDHVIQA